jgi:regulator of replication initiation timing
MSGNGNDGKVYGATIGDDRNGEAGKAYRFDGMNDYIDLGDNSQFDGRDSQTISLWLSISTLGQPSHGPKIRPVLSKWYSAPHGNSANRNSFLIGEKGGLQYADFASEFNNSSINSQYSVTIDKWMQWAFTFYNGEVSAFLNGDKHNNNIVNTTYIQDSSESLLVGNWYKNYASSYLTFHGSIDDIRIYNRALTEAEVIALYELEKPIEHKTPPTPPKSGPGTPPDPDYKDTIAELKRLLTEKDTKLAHCEKEMDAKNKEIGELTSENATLHGEVKSLNGKVTGLETEVATLKTDNDGLKGQIQNLREDNQNISYELTVANEHLEEAIKVAETPFINGWVYDPVRGWIFTDAEHFPLVYTDNDQTWNYYELGSSDPRYFFNYSTQEWVAWDIVPEEVEQTVAANTNL